MTSGAATVPSLVEAIDRWKTEGGALRLGAHRLRHGAPERRRHRRRTAGATRTRGPEPHRFGIRDRGTATGNDRSRAIGEALISPHTPALQRRRTGMQIERCRGWEDGMINGGRDGTGAILDNVSEPPSDRGFADAHRTYRSDPRCRMIRFSRLRASASTCSFHRWLFHSGPPVLALESKGAGLRLVRDESNERRRPLGVTSALWHRSGSRLGHGAPPCFRAAMS